MRDYKIALDPQDLFGCTSCETTRLSGALTNNASVKVGRLGRDCSFQKRVVELTSA